MFTVLFQNEVDSSFDVSKFKQANVTKPQHQNQLVSIPAKHVYNKIIYLFAKS